MKRTLILILLCSIIVSCKSKHGVVTKKNKQRNYTERVAKIEGNVEQPTVQVSSDPKPTVSITKKSYTSTVEEYISTYRGIAMEEMRRYGIPASITLAQGILESGSGRGRLSVEANNHFGIKCHDWTGEKIYHDDDRKQECFRKYDHPHRSFEDHSIFLSSRGRYADLFKLKQSDYKGWAKGLRAAGYATDRKYPEKLIDLIERYQLNQFDSMVLGRDFQTVIVEPDRHTVVKGDTLYSISRRYGVTVQDIQTLNAINGTNLSIGQVLIIRTNK